MRSRCCIPPATRWVPQASPAARALRRHAVHRRRSPRLASVARSACATACRGQKVTVPPGDRLRPSRPVALHLSPLLGGRGDGDRPSDRLARPLPRSRRDDGQPAARRVDHRPASAGACDEPRARCRDRRAGPVRLLDGAGRVERRRGPHAQHARCVRLDRITRPGHASGSRRRCSVQPAAAAAASVRRQDEARAARRVSDRRRRLSEALRRGSQQ